MSLMSITTICFFGMMKIRQLLGPIGWEWGLKYFKKYGIDGFYLQDLFRI